MLYRVILLLYALLYITVGENIIATTKIRNNYGAIQSFIFVAIVGRAITIWEAIQKRSHETIYKTYPKIGAKRLRATTFAIAKLEER